MKKTALILFSIVALALAGCKDKPKTEAPQAGPSDKMPEGHPSVPGTPAAPGTPGAVNPHANMKAQEIPAGVGKKGKVVQTMNSGGYTYVEAADEKGAKTWLAMPEVKVNAGDAIEFPDTPPMVNFQSKTLKRTFEKISFIPGIRIVK